MALQADSEVFEIPDPITYTHFAVENLLNEVLCELQNGANHAVWQEANAAWAVLTRSRLDAEMQSRADCCTSHFGTTIAAP